MRRSISFSSSKDERRNGGWFLPNGSRGSGRSGRSGGSMIKSMTGFAAVTREEDRATVAVTIRAVNHRYLDLQLRMPQSLAALEADVRALVSKHVARRRLELSVSLQIRQAPSRQVALHHTVRL